MTPHRVCRDCEKRYLGCHAHCPEYIEEKILADKEKAERMREKIVAADYREFRRSGIRKVLQHKGRK